MATKSSVQNGLWDDTGVWGGSIPASGDTANIRHTITYNIDDDITPIGTINVTGGGILQWTGSTGRQALRISTLLNQSNGTVSGCAGTQIRIHQGGGWTLQTAAGTKLYMNGTNPNSATTLSTLTTTGNEYIDVVDASGFGSGDYISVFDETNAKYNDRTDEVFRVHSVDSNKLYIRKIVGPIITLAQSINSGENAFYSTSDVRCWRAGDKFVIDNEAFTVDSIDGVNNIVYTVNNATVTHATSTVGYETGVELEHETGDKVYKLCATIISAIAGDNYIDVGCAGGWASDDVLSIGGSSYAKCERRTIQSISLGGGVGGSDRIVLTSTLSYSHDKDGLVVKLNRDCRFIGTTDDTVRSNAAYIYFLATSTSTSRAFRLINFEMKTVGNAASSAYYSGFVYRGSGTVGAVLIGCSIYNSHASSTNGLFGGYTGYYMTIKNCTSYLTHYGIGFYSSAEYTYATGNISIKSGSRGFLTYPLYADQWEYNFVEGAAGYGFYSDSESICSKAMKYNGRASNKYKYLYLNYVVSPIVQATNQAQGSYLSRVFVKNAPTTRIIWSSETKQNGTLVNGLMTDETWKTGTPVTNSSLYVSPDSMGVLQGVTLFTNYQFISTKKLMTFYYGYAETDEIIKMTGNSWKFTPLRNDVDSIIGFFALIHGIRNKVITIKGWARRTDTFDGTGPFILFRDDDFVTRATYSMPDISNVWQPMSFSYTIPSDGLYVVYFGGYGSAGNFWLQTPQLWSDGCDVVTAVQENIWLKRSSAYNECGIVLGGTVIG